MAPKRKGGNAGGKNAGPPKKKFNALRDMCIRCPNLDNLSNADFNPQTYQHSTFKCTGEASATGDNLWWGFQPSSSGTVSLSDDPKECKQLLESAITTSVAAATGVYDDAEAIADTRKVRSNLKFKGRPVHQADLTHAFDVIKGADQQAAAQKAEDRKQKQKADSAAAKAMSSTVTTATQGNSNQSAQGLSENASAAGSQSLAQGMQHMSIGTTGTPASSSDHKSALELYADRPPRIAAGQNRSKLETNHFQITLRPKCVFYEYQIGGIPPTASRPKKKVLIQRFIDDANCVLHGQAASFACNHEGKVIAWARLGPNVPPGTMVSTIPVDDYDRDSHNQPTATHSMTITFLRTIDLNDLQAFVQGKNRSYRESGAAQTLNILIGHGVDQQPRGVYRIGDNRYFTDNNSSAFQGNPYGGHGLIALRGFSCNVEPGLGKLTLNVNTAFSAFYSPALVSDYIRTYYGGDNTFMSNTDAQTHLIGLRVRIMYDRCKQNETDLRKDSEEGRIKTITGFSPNLANQISFTDRHGKTVTVWSHFQQEYPTAASKSRGSGQICVNTSSLTAGQECYFLADQLQVLPGQLYRRTLDKLDPTFTEQMLRFACRKPDENRQAILNEGLPALGFQSGNPPRDPPILTRSGVSVARNMLRVPFRIADQPEVRYCDPQGRLIAPKFLPLSSWTTRDMRFCDTSKPVKGEVLFFRLQRMKYPTNARHYIDGFRRAYHLNGIKLGGTNAQIPNTWTELNTNGFTAANVKTEVDKLKKTAGMLALVLPENNSKQRVNHSEFRIATDQLLGVPSLTFCEDRMVGSNKLIPKEGPSKGIINNSALLIPYMANNAMKLNVRLGNENHKLPGAFDILSSNGICDTLVLGTDLIHPKQTSAKATPSIGAVVGSVDGCFATFWGSARRVPPVNDRKLEIIPQISMQSMVQERIVAWKQQNNGRMPARILFYRDGTGDSQYQEIRATEVQAIRDAWAAENGDQTLNSVAITAVVAVKRHGTRFFPPAGTPRNHMAKDNCMPGTVVDSEITSPYFFDFYLQSHHVEEGSAKPTHYFVLENGMNFGELSLQNLTNAFCYNFSHSTTPVSYASPAYMADKLCERVSLYMRRWIEKERSVLQYETASDVVRTAEMDKDWNRGGQVNGNPWNKDLNEVMFWM